MTAKRKRRRATKPKPPSRTTLVRRAGLPGVRAVEHAGYVVDAAGRVRTPEGAYAKLRNVRAAITRTKNRERKGQLAAVPAEEHALPAAEVSRRERVGAALGPSARKTLERSYAAEDALKERRTKGARERREVAKREEKKLPRTARSEKDILDQWKNIAPDSPLRKALLAQLGQRALVSVWTKLEPTRSEKEVIGHLLTDEGLRYRDAVLAIGTRETRRLERLQLEAIKLLQRSGGVVNTADVDKLAAQYPDVARRAIFTIFVSPSATP